MRYPFGVPFRRSAGQREGPCSAVAQLQSEVNRTLADEAIFHYRGGELHCEGASAARIADACGTPCYVYSARSFRTRYRRIRDAFGAWDPLVCFSVKSCANLSVLKLLADEGSGFDVVSGGELHRVLRIGAEPERIVYAGAGKTDAEIEYALSRGVRLFNVESRPELTRINELALRAGKVARIALRLNPDVEAGTHRKTATGKGHTKFGIGITEAEELYREAAAWDGVEVLGIHLHLGSPIYTTEPYETALAMTVGLVERLRAAGRRVECIDIGGGYCISYTGEPVIGPAQYAGAVASYLEKLGCAVIIEPGRYIAGNSAVMLTRVTYRKENEFGKRFLICDAAMNDLIRPALYEAFHRVWPARSSGGMPAVMRPGDEEFDGFTTEKVDVVGPVCESGDVLASDRALPPVVAGDLLAVFSAGAYGFTMSSNYNARPRAAEVLVDGDKWRVVRRRETWDDLIGPEVEFL